MRKRTPQNPDLHGNVPDHCPVALLLLDVLNDLKFPGAGPLIRQAPLLAKNIAALKERCRKAGIPAIYVNDNRQKWRSDSQKVIAGCLERDATGGTFVESLAPSKDDYIVLKPKHSAFFATPLDTILSYLECRTIILVGLTTNACVLTTACEIHVRDLDLFVPSDCVASPDAKQHSIALELMRKSFGARIRRSKGIDLRQVTKT